MRAVARIQPIAHARKLSVEDIRCLSVPVKVEDNFLILEKSPKGWKLRAPVKIPLESVLQVGERGLIAYILSSLASDRPKLIPFVFQNETLISLARYFLRHCSGSTSSLYSYVDSVSRYSRWLGYDPDRIVRDVKQVGNIADPERIQSHREYLEQYLAELQDEGLTPGRVDNVIKHIRTFYRVNGVEIKLAVPLKRRVTYRYRSPTPEELAQLLNIADLREKVIVSMLALGGFRESTLVRLQYRHVREDLEKGTAPVHIHVEAKITKGKYNDYDTFLGSEAAEYLRLYLEQRRQGSPDGRKPPETLTDESPLIIDVRSHTPRPLGSKQIRKLVHNLYVRTDLIKPSRGRMYDLRAHSLRKYFKTQLLALGVQPDYVDYMMGHAVDTYNDIQSLGIEKLRSIYSASGLSIKPKTRLSQMDKIKEMIRALGRSPEEILTKEALLEGATLHVGQEDLENEQLKVLRATLRDLIRQEVLEAQ